MLKDWRSTQKKFFKESIEFEQDQRIINFFVNKGIPTYGHGEISYFLDKINFTENLQTYPQALLIFNKKIEKNELKNFIQKFKSKIIDDSKICISINKFQIYSKKSSPNVDEDYDLALHNFIFQEFVNSKIEYFYVKNLEGDSFNFASPTTQFFIDYKI
jgi:hypothetical protein